MNQVFMSEMVEIVDSLEIRLPKLFSKIDRLEESSNHLKQELAKAAGIIQKQSQQRARTGLCGKWGVFHQQRLGTRFL
jgi:chaperonin cofactor prefoldin